MSKITILYIGGILSERSLFLIKQCKVNGIDVKLVNCDDLRRVGLHATECIVDEVNSLAKTSAMAAQESLDCTKSLKLLIDFEYRYRAQKDKWRKYHSCKSKW